MSRVKYEQNRTVCEELEILRKCHETHDYSPLMATVERIQAHANAMEASLWERSSMASTCRSLISSFKETAKKDKRKIDKPTEALLKKISKEVRSSDS